MLENIKKYLFISKKDFMISLNNTKNEIKGMGMNNRSRSGFTLIELLVVITILAILAGAAIPYVQNYVKESRVSKAKADLEEIKKALAIYETREGTYKDATVLQLTGRYLNKSPIDPWGKAYEVATGAGTVYSCGEDRIAGSLDDISVNYQPPLALVQAKWVDSNQSGAVDTQNTPDYIQLIFSRKIKATSPAVVTPANAHNYFTWTSASPIDTSLNWTTFSLESSGNMITIDLANGVTNVFGPGSDTFQVKDGAGILDLAPQSNKCITSQTVLIGSL